MKDSSIDVIRRFNKYIIYNKNLINDVSPDIFNPDNLTLNATSVSVGGRDSAWFIEINHISAVLRHYKRGGLISKLIKNRYIWNGIEKTRSFQEFNLLNKMQNTGLHVPQPIAALVIRDNFTYNAAIIVRTIKNTKTLAEIILQNPSVNNKISESVAKSILDMHDNGFWHSDLNAYNILIDQQNIAWIIDFDKALQTNLSSKQRKNNLFRLRRSILKISNNKANMWCNSIINDYSVMLDAKNNPLH